jgi:hypothetical protein
VPERLLVPPLISGLQKNERINQPINNPIKPNRRIKPRVCNVNMDMSRGPYSKNFCLK